MYVASNSFNSSLGIETIQQLSFSFVGKNYNLVTACKSVHSTIVQRVNLGR